MTLVLILYKVTVAWYWALNTYSVTLAGAGPISKGQWLIHTSARLTSVGMLRSDREESHVPVLWCGSWGSSLGLLLSFFFFFYFVLIFPPYTPDRC